MKLKLFIVVAAVMLIVGCTRGTNASNIEIKPPNYKANFIVNENELPLKKGSYRWEMKNKGTTEVITTDHISPIQQAKQLKMQTFEKGQMIQIQIENDPSYEVIRWIDENTLHYPTVTNNQMQLPNESGEVVYEVRAKWKEGFQSYVIKLNVQ